ncbi:hypothetical protein CALCODRAFT_83022 [Calocera cornea HHB12733]|uniref:Uncharacterized protein n=1 Tax=Calocera cornea HHB12733 TaxID=1353952 RepID=A0A165DDN9_9BASI|nr:hypothetical protein CALCODRAFT_83022 [Calocera cornea HHB12733]
MAQASRSPASRNALSAQLLIPPRLRAQRTAQRRTRLLLPSRRAPLLCPLTAYIPARQLGRTRPHPRAASTSPPARIHSSETPSPLPAAPAGYLTGLGVGEQSDV